MENVWKKSVASKLRMRFRLSDIYYLSKIRQCVEYTSKLVGANVKERERKKGREIVRMNSFIVCHGTLDKPKPNRMNKKASQTHCLVNDGAQNILPIFDSIVNLIYSKMRKLNFKLNYFEADFYLSTARPMFYLHTISLLACVGKSVESCVSRKIIAFGLLCFFVLSFHKLEM